MSSPTTHDKPEGDQRSKYLIYFLLLLNVLNFVDRQLVASLAYQIEQALDIGHAEFGLLFGYAFIVFYTFMGILLGTVADRWNRPRLIAIGLTVWSLLTAVSGAAQRFGHMVVARMLVGVGEATLTPAALSMLSDSLPPEKRSRAAGIYYAGSPIGFAVSLFVTALFEPIIGWRGCFYVLGLLGLFLVIPTLLLRDPPRRVIRDQKLELNGDQENLTTWASLKLLGRTLKEIPSFSLTLLGGCIAVYFQNAMNFLVLWMQAERGFDLQQATTRMGMMVIVGGVLGSLVGGYLGDWWEARKEGGRLYFASIAFLFVAPLGCVYLFADPHTQPWLFYPPLALTMAMSMTMFGPVFTVVQDLAPPQISATSVGFALFCFNVFGVGLGPLVTGWIGDLYSLSTGLLVSVFVGTLSVVPFYLAARRFGKDQKRLEAIREL